MANIRDYEILEYETPDISYSGRYLRNKNIKYPKFYVYGWRRGSVYLYIGKTASGIQRFCKSHRIIGNREKRLETDYIDIWIGIDYKIVSELEKELIRKYKPKYNIDFNPNAKRKLRLISKVIKKEIIIIKEKEKITIPSELLMQCKNEKELKELKEKYK